MSLVGKLVGKKVYITMASLLFAEGVVQAHVRTDPDETGSVYVDLPNWGRWRASAGDWHLYESDARRACIANLAKGRQEVAQMTSKLNRINTALRGGRLPRKEDVL